MPTGPQRAQPALWRNDRWLAAALLVVGGLSAWLWVDWQAVPFEDAAMLMRYSEHLAEGHGIVWNIGENPVDGATDFLFMAAVALVVKCGLPVQVAARMLELLAHLLTVLVVFAAARQTPGVPRFAGVISALCLSVGPGLAYISAYFGTPFFALFVGLSWLGASRIVHGQGSSNVSALTVAAMLLMGLTRPEGVFMAGFMLLAVFCARGWSRSRQLVWRALLVFAVVGGAYLAWRWSYFGYPLPNPFYKKGGGTLHPQGLLTSLSNTLTLSLPFLLACAVALRSRRSARLMGAGLVPAVGFALIWVLLSDEMNWGMRFQYAALVVVLMSWPWALVGIRKDLGIPRFVQIKPQWRALLVAMAVVATLACLRHESAIARGALSVLRPDGRHDVGLALAPYAAKDYCLVTTEAGLLPFYSHWRSVDAWGLNDQWIAHNGAITEEYLDLVAPSMIVFHAHYSPQTPPDLLPDASDPRSWHAMVRVLHRYAEAHGFILAAAFGLTPHNAHYYFVSDEIADADAIVSLIRTIAYPWPATRDLARNQAGPVAAPRR